MDYGNMSASKIKRDPSFDGYLFGGSIFKRIAENGVKIKNLETRAKTTKNNGSPDKKD